MDGKTVLVTGASSGIGKATARALAGMGAHMVMVARDRERGEAARAEIGAGGGDARVDLLLADLSVQASIHALAGEVRARYPRLDVLVNAAGGQFQRRTVTQDGLEYTFALNHLNYFLLTNLLLPVLRDSAPARVVNVASSAEAMSGMNFDDLQGERRYSFSRAYGQSKLANVLFTYELARRLADTGVTVNAVAPGFVRSNFHEGATGWYRLFRDLVIYPFLAKTPEQGAETVVYLASSPEVEGVTGGFWADKQTKRSSKRSYDEAVGKRLWDASAALTGVPASAIGGELPTADAPAGRSLAERGASG